MEYFAEEEERKGKMNISEATHKAMSENKCISNKGMRGVIKVRPTNTIANCILMGADGSNPSKYGWQPSAEDLMRLDWEVVD